ncbi:MAG: S24/S26 family peptidase [Bacteroidales bacterium]|nr:S24/S26 family peptidase [Bacteroidales bacterium]
MWQDILASGRTVTLRVRGRSMRPLWHHNRDSVRLSSLTGELRVGLIVLAEVEPEHYVIHRIVALQPERVVLRGDGNPYAREYCSPHQVLGVITSFTLCRCGRCYVFSTSGWFWKLYSALWPSSALLRRCLLKLDRCLFGADDLTQ